MKLIRFELATAALGLSVLAAACGGSGNGQDRGVISSFSPAFTLRQDVRLNNGNVMDAEVVDLNGDGIDDIVEVEFFDKTISAALGNPDGSFTPLFRLTTPSSPWDLHIADYDGDGNDDMAVACHSSNGGLPSLTVYRGQGDGSFVQDSTVIFSSDPIALRSGFLAGSALESILVALPGTAEVARFEFSGPSSLNQIGSFPSSSVDEFGPISMAVIDVDGDSINDLAVGEISYDGSDSDRIAATISDGTGGFAAPIVLTPLASYPLINNAGDINGDLIDDLSVAQLESDRAMFFLGSTGGLGGAMELQFTGLVSSVLFADLNDDGLKDVTATLLDEKALAVRLATSQAVFGPAEIYNVGSLPRAAAIGVFGKDSDVDLFCSNRGDVSILHGDSSGSFRAAKGFPVGDEPQFVRTVDMDDDGIIDIVSIDQFQNKVVFMKGVGDGTFTNMGQVPLDPSTTAIAGYLQIHDFNEDGQPDVATTINSTGEFRLIRNAGNLPLDTPLAGDSTTVGSSPLGFDAGDLNGDGHLDTVVANSGDNTIQVLIGGGDGTFSARGAVGAPARPLVPLIGDWNADGDLDVAVLTGEADGTDTRLLIYAGDGAGNLAFEGEQVLPQLSTVLQSGDFNEDGLIDLAASQPQVQSDEVLVLQNNGNFSFDLQRLKLGFRMGTLEVFDVNQDTHLDLVVPLGDGELVLALGDGTGQFPTILPPAGEQFPAPGNISTSAFADVNGDGLPDLLMVSPATPHLWVALNDGTSF